MSTSRYLEGIPFRFIELSKGSYMNYNFIVNPLDFKKPNDP